MNDMTEDMVEETPLETMTRKYFALEAKYEELRKEFAKELETVRSLRRSNDVMLVELATIGAELLEAQESNKEYLEQIDELSEWIRNLQRV